MLSDPQSIGYTSSMDKDPNINELLDKQSQQGVLVVISGASGAGKDAVMKALLEKYPNMQKLVTTNSRPKRNDEVEGFDYHFISREEFEKLISEEAFFEWVEYRGQLRGGQKKHVQEALNSGKDVIWRIDVKGVKNIRQKVKELYPNSVFILLVVKDINILKQRMEKRASETQTDLEWSIDMAHWEQKQFHDFDYVVENQEDKLNQTVDIIAQIIEAHRHKVI